MDIEFYGILGLRMPLEKSSWSIVGAKEERLRYPGGSSGSQMAIVSPVNTKTTTTNIKISSTVKVNEDCHWIR